MAAIPGIQLTKKFEQALSFAIQSHEGQYRKGNRAPYVSHPMAVASLVMEYGGDEDQAIAALLHDTIEDCGIMQSEIEEKFGKRIAVLVQECSEPLVEKSYSWQERKTAYIQQVKDASTDALLIILCDKYHNLHSLWRDLEYRGDAAWKIFHESKDKMGWYYLEMDQIFTACVAFTHKRVSGLVNTYSDLRQLVFN